MKALRYPYGMRLNYKLYTLYKLYINSTSFKAKARGNEGAKGRSEPRARESVHQRGVKQHHEQDAA